MTKQRYVYLALLVLLTALSYWRILTFTFWKDDWFLLWSALNKLDSFYLYWAHPGTPIEFLVATPLFGTNPILWQLTGLAIHLAIALTVVLFIYEITQSKFAARLTGIFYSASFAGMDAVGWPSAHVVLWASLFLLTGLYFFTRFMRKHLVSSLWISLLYLGIAVVIDPFRVLPVFLILPLITHIWDKAFLFRVIRAEVFILVSVLILLIVTLGHHIFGSQLATHLNSPSQLFTHINVIGNYFNSISNLFTGWLIRFPEDGSTGVYNPFWARFGFFIFCLAAGVGYDYFKRARKSIGIVLLLLLWIFLFYIPNWLFEPRLTMGGTHRYMVIPAIGFSALVGYLLSLIRNRAIGGALAVFFIIVNIVTANHFSAAASEYRSASLVSGFWKKVDADVPQNIRNLIFAFTGEDPVKTYALSLSGGYPFAMRRHIADQSLVPVTTEDRKYMDKLLCEDDVPLNHVFAWEVKNDGTIASVTLPTRRELLVTAIDHDCVPIIDQAALEGSR